MQTTNSCNQMPWVKVYYKLILNLVLVMIEILCYGLYLFLINFDYNLSQVSCKHSKLVIDLRNIPFRFWNVTWVWDLKYFVKWSSCFKYGIKLWFYWFPKYFYWFNSKIFFILILYSWFWEWYYFVKFLNIWCWLMWESYEIWA
jgi:hypothetical protein